MPLALPAASARACYTPHRHGRLFYPHTRPHGVTANPVTLPLTSSRRPSSFFSFTAAPQSVHPGQQVNSGKFPSHKGSSTNTFIHLWSQINPQAKQSGHIDSPNSSDKFSLNPVKSQFPWASSGETPWLHIQLQTQWLKSNCPLSLGLRCPMRAFIPLLLHFKPDLGIYINSASLKMFGELCDSVLCPR